LLGLGGFIVPEYRIDNMVRNMVIPQILGTHFRVIPPDCFFFKLGNLFD